MIKKAVFPVAGLGTRFLPATKANPKEMLPIVDKPLIQYAVEEAVLAGVSEVIFVTSSSKRSIEDHFDSNFELEEKLMRDGKHALLEIVKNVLPDNVKCIYTRQSEALGLGHAILCAEPIVGKEPFLVLLADDLLEDKKDGLPCVKQMVELYQEVQASIIAVKNISPEDCKKYGVIGFSDKFVDNVTAINTIVEKPNPEYAPSNYGVIGRYVLTPKIFDLLRNTKFGVGKELQLTDAIAKLIALESVYAMNYAGIRYDCGSKLGFLEATVAFGLKHPETSDEFKKFLAAKAADILNK